MTGRNLWLTRSPAVRRALRSRGLEAHRPNSVKGFLAAVRAGVHVFDCYALDTQFWASRGAKMVNLWHGIPLKKIERDIDTPDHQYYDGFHGGLWERLKGWFLRPWLYRRNDLMIASSPEVAGLIGSAFGIPEERVVCTGFPRNEVLLGAENDDVMPVSDQVMRLRQSRSRGARVVGYFPTFRDAADENDTVPLDWNHLNRWLGEHGLLFVVKLHAHDGRRPGPTESLENVVFLPPDTDLYTVLPAVDVLVTDYSSVYLDFLLLDRPIVFYAYDLEEYLKSCRSMYFEFSEVTPGPVVADIDGLLAALEDVLVAQRDPYASERGQLRKRFHQECGESASQLVCQAIRRQLLRLPE